MIVHPVGPVDVLAVEGDQQRQAGVVDELAVDASAVEVGAPDLRGDILRPVDVLTVDGDPDDP